MVFMNEKELEFLIKQGESLTIEFKRSFSSRIDEDITAFSNSSGGRILLGVEDSETAAGFALTNDIRGKIISLARNCKPSIEVSISQIGKIAVISVPEGRDKLYSCSDGYYRRLDGATQKMNPEEIRLFFTQNELLPFEKKTAPGAELSELSKKKLGRFLAEAKIDAKTSEAKALLASFSMLKEGRLNNAGVMFFSKEPRRIISQCQSSMIAFKGTEPDRIFDRMDVKDDLLEQFSQAIFFLKKHLNLSSTIRGVKRIDAYEIPLEALREAVANAIVHRDYSAYGTDLAIRVFDDRVEIANPAKLAPDVKASDLEGVSIRHNEIIADMFSRLDIVERAGTGIRKMRRLMEEAGLPAPEIKLGVFYRIAFARPKKKAGSEKGSEKSSEKILAIIRQNSGASAEEIAKNLGISSRAVEKNIAKLKEKGLLRRVGPDKGGRWEAAKE
ncbi:hypothetical protein AUJ17_03820 [Candidatus Micrarchaeota archaeon CG1_02_47_40]|nr:MAG: hypothetical protein AUJ17_03820 [Candidatus Micrarchaeota archaeon CG1_02_47_40]